MFATEGSGSGLSDRAPGDRPPFRKAVYETIHGDEPRELASNAMRRAVLADAAAIAAVFDAAVRAGWTFLDGLADEPMFTAREWEQDVADHAPPNVLLVATDPTAGVVGLTALHPEDGEMFLLFVDPAHAGRCIGRVLLAAAHDAQRAAGCTEAFLFTHEQNERALSVYAAAGYEPDGRVRESDFRGTHIREPRLVKRL